MPVCSKCGAELPNDAKFCFSCGAPQHTADEKEFFFIRNEKEPSNTEGTFTDPRDGEVYKTCKIGDQIWMAENLRYRCKKGGSCAYDDDASNVPKYGRLYEWDVAEEACPPGWCLPSKEDFEEMIKFVEKEYDVSDALRAVEWNDGIDAYGFSAVPAGIRIYDRNKLDYDYRLMGKYVHMWTSSLENDDCSYYFEIAAGAGIDFNGCGIDCYDKLNRYKSIRCIKNTPQRLVRLKEAIDQKRIQTEEEARKAEEEDRKAQAERLALAEQKLNRDIELIDEERREKRNNVIISVVVGVVFAAALMYISQDIIASIILGVGCMLHYFFTPNLKVFLRLFFACAIACSFFSIFLALLFSTYTSGLAYSTAFLYCSEICTLLSMVFLRWKMS